MNKPNHNFCPFIYLSKFKVEREEGSNWMSLSHMTPPWLYGAYRQETPIL